MSRTFAVTLLGIAVLALAAAGAAEDENRPYGLGRPATEGEIAAWDIDVTPDGGGLPPGRGTPSQGAEIYRLKCAVCHGNVGPGEPRSNDEASGFWEEAPAPTGYPPLAGGRGTLSTAQPIRTVGSYWPYATTLYDYLYRTMPLAAPQSLTADEVYALVAYLLYVNGIVGEEAEMSPESLPRVVMPNREGFVSPDPRPDTR